MRERGGGADRERQLDRGQAAVDRHAGLPVAKAAVLSLSRLVADLYAKDGILCNAVAPGPTRSPAWLAHGGLADQAAERSGKDRDEVLEGVGAGRPIGRLAEPEEIAAVIVFLCSDRADLRAREPPGAWTEAPSRSSSSLSQCRPRPSTRCPDS